jgi:hypothetical protein
MSDAAKSACLKASASLIHLAIAIAEGNTVKLRETPKAFDTNPF